MLTVAALLVAVACLGAAWWLLRRVGSGYRVARLLRSAPEVPLAEAVRLAADREQRYVRLIGRVSSDEEFPDENQRPLVFRRRRLERWDAGTWQPIGEDRQAVPFGIEDRTTFVAVDAEALGDGLVVVPREAAGTAAELPPGLVEQLGVTLRDDAPVRLRVDQVSAVEHATVAGVPVFGEAGPTITSGLGRPLIVTTLEPEAAMRLLAGDRRGSVVAAAVLLVVGLGSLAVAAVAAVGGW